MSADLTHEVRVASKRVQDEHVFEVQTYMGEKKALTVRSSVERSSEIAFSVVEKFHTAATGAYRLTANVARGTKNTVSARHCCRGTARLQRPFAPPVCTARLHRPFAQPVCTAPCTALLSKRARAPLAPSLFAQVSSLLSSARTSVSSEGAATRDSSLAEEGSVGMAESAAEASRASRIAGAQPLRLSAVEAAANAARPWAVDRASALGGASEAADAAGDGSTSSGGRHRSDRQVWWGRIGLRKSNSASGLAVRRGSAAARESPVRTSERLRRASAAFEDIESVKFTHIPKPSEGGGRGGGPSPSPARGGSLPASPSVSTRGGSQLDVKAILYETANWQRKESVTGRMGSGEGTALGGRGSIERRGSLEPDLSGGDSLEMELSTATNLNEHTVSTNLAGVDDENEPNREEEHIDTLTDAQVTACW